MTATTSATTALAIQTDKLTKDFGRVVALDGLTLDIPPGIVFGFLGPNGSGKTTTIRLLLGLLEPTSGRASVLGCDTRTQADDIRQRTGALLEHNGLYERLTAYDNLEFYARIWRMSASQRKRRIEELLTHLGLWDRRKDVVGKWSRGMKQKLAVARTLIHFPQLIFLDEPTAGLDPIAAAALRDDLAALARREGVTVFLTTHNLAEAEKLCALVGVIRSGKLLAVGTPQELRTQAGPPRAEIVADGITPALFADLRALPQVAGAELSDGRLRVDLRDGARVAPLVTLLVQGGAQVEEVRKGAASLEEAFLDLMEERT